MTSSALATVGSLDTVRGLWLSHNDPLPTMGERVNGPEPTAKLVQQRLNDEYDDNSRSAENVQIIPNCEERA